jgi:hypothetical protein
MSFSTAGSAPFQRGIGFARVWLLCLLLSCGAAHAQTLVPNMEAVNGSTRIMLAGGVAEPPFAVRVTNAQGQPMAGVQVEFHVNHCLDMLPPPGGGCPPAALYGRFNASSGSPGAVSDATGLATSSAFVAGSIPGQYEVYARVPEQQVGTLQIPYTVQFLLFQVHQQTAGGAGAPAGTVIPTTSAWGLIAMMALLLGVAMVRLKGN